MHMDGNTKCEEHHLDTNERRVSFSVTKVKTSEKPSESSVSKEVRGIARRQLFHY